MWWLLENNKIIIFKLMKHIIEEFISRRHSSERGYELLDLFYRIPDLTLGWPCKWPSYNF